MASGQICQMNHRDAMNDYTGCYDVLLQCHGKLSILELGSKSHNFPTLFETPCKGMSHQIHFSSVECDGVTEDGIELVGVARTVFYEASETWVGLTTGERTPHRIRQVEISELLLSRNRHEFQVGQSSEQETTKCELNVVERREDQWYTRL